MSGLRHVLAATDFSPGAMNAARRAAGISKVTGASLDLFHAVNLSGLSRLREIAPGLPADLGERLTAQPLEEINRVAAGLTAAHGVDVGVGVGAGPASVQIDAQAVALSADLVVLGDRGAGALARLILGSTASRMAETASCSVLIVKRSPRGPYRNVLVPVDFSGHSLPALRTALAVAPGSGITLFHAYGLPFEGKLRAAGIRDELLEDYRTAERATAYEKLRALARAAGLPERAANLVALRGPVLLRILDLEKERDCDLIVMGRHGDGTPLERVFLASVTKQVLAQSHADILISPGGQASGERAAGPPARPARVGPSD